MGKKTSADQAKNPDQAKEEIDQLTAAEGQKRLLVNMVRDPVYGEPTTAQVHSDEVAAWEEHSWQVEQVVQ